MSGIPKSMVIRTRGQLSGILRDLKRAVSDGDLSPVEPAIPLFSVECSLIDIPEDGPWPDYFELYFQEPSTGERYKLSAETYHGAGGDWGKDLDA